MRVELSIGSFEVRRHDHNVQNLTTIMSASFYDDGPVPSNVRREIVMLTCPKVKKLTACEVI